MTDSELFIRKEIIAVARDCTAQTINRDMLIGKFPRPDTRKKLPHGELYAWKFSTLQRHNPALAERCLALVRFTQLMPPIVA